MCGRYAITTPAEAMARMFGVDAAGLMAGPRYNIAPSQTVPIIRHGASGRVGVSVRWGLIPHWVKGAHETALINARSETVLEKPSFRAAFQRRRCLVPVNGFYEWSRGEGRTAEPYYIAPPDGRLLALAGIWERWQAPNGEEIVTMAILTVAANETLSGIHNRMPAVIAADRWNRWLNCDSTSPEDARGLLTSAPEDLFRAVRVSTAVNKVANDDPGLIEPLTEEEVNAAREAHAARAASHPKQYSFFA